ncbi:hypothetical protein ZWY2020_012591 [Hordeum vulgare]|nr:hypothetical protein ZWY2020_028733 [Hordeum vulgare]KAI5010454.1 hypothetical protein ZWY2020_012591 [Hordeum vulgare]
MLLQSTGWMHLLFSLDITALSFPLKICVATIFHLWTGLTLVLSTLQIYYVFICWYRSVLKMANPVAGSEIW